jgi:hypothetical protein
MFANHFSKKKKKFETILLLRFCIEKRKICKDLFSVKGTKAVLGSLLAILRAISYASKYKYDARHANTSETPSYKTPVVIIFV